MRIFDLVLRALPFSNHGNHGLFEACKLEKDTHTRKELYCNLGGCVFAISSDCCNERYFCQMSSRSKVPYNLPILLPFCITFETIKIPIFKLNTANIKQLLEVPRNQKLTTRIRCGMSRQFLAHLFRELHN